MSRGKASSFREIFKEFSGELVLIDSSDLVTLRGHALIEFALKELLALRLGTAAETLPDLTFARLVVLGTAGMPSKLQELLLHINRIRNYVAHHVHTRELDPKVAEFFRERTHFGIDWRALNSDERKRYVWAVCLGMVATAIGTLSVVLAEFRKDQRDLRAETFGYDEPTVLAEIGGRAMDLNLESWLSEDFAPASAKPVGDD